MDGIVISKVSKQYFDVKGNPFLALNQVSFEWRQGENLAVIGESGSGKSTLARLIIGLEKPTSGNIQINGEDIARWKFHRWRQERRRIQAVFQDASGTMDPAYSVYHNVEEALRNLSALNAKERRARIDELMALTHMSPKLLQVPVRQLSGGEQRRLSLLRALSLHPSYLILDEVTSGLDLISADAVLSVLEKYHTQYGCAYLLITHDNPSFYTLKAVTDIESMETVDDTTLVIHYTHPYFAYLNDFCWNDVMTICAPSLLIEGDFQTVSGVSGTGPYVYDEYVAGEYTRFVRNENYWGDTPYWDEIIVKYIPDSTSRIQALQTGEIDMIYGSALLTYEEYQQASTLPGMAGQMADLATRARDITLNASRPALNDLRVRQAIAYAINKDEIVEGLTYGYEEVAELPFTPDSPYMDIELETHYNYDLEKANELLDEAGWVMNESTGIREKDGETLILKLTMDSGFDSLNQSLATLIQTQLGKVGIDLTITGLEQMEWYSGFMAGDFDLTFWQPQYNYAAPHCWFTPMDTMTPQTVSLQGMDDAQEFLDAIQKTIQTDDEAELHELFTYLYNYDMGNVIDIPLTYQKDMIVYNTSKISGYDFIGTPCFFNVTNLHPAE